MPSFEVRSHRNRNRPHSRRHLSSTSTSPSNDPSSLTDVQIHTTNTGPSNSSSDERPSCHKSPGSSISSSSLFDDDQWRRTVRGFEHEGLKDTVWWGYLLLGTTWIVFILGIGNVCGIWEWSLKPIRAVQERTVWSVLEFADSR